MNETPDTPPETTALPSIHKVAAKLSSGALFSKVFGFVREISMAHVVGVAALADSFRSSLTIVLLPLAFLQNESVPAILIPRMQEAGRNGEGARRLAAMTAALTALGALLMLLTMSIVDFMVDTMLTGMPPEQQEITSYFVHIMAMSMPASVALNCLAAGEIAIGKTRVTNARASVLNLGVILGLTMLVLTDHAAMLAICFTLAFNVLALWALWSLWREDALSFKDLSFADIWLELKIFVRRVLPFLPLPVAEQTNVWLERLLASHLVTGAIASMDYARTLTDSAFLLLSQPVGLSVLAQGGNDRADEQAQALASFVVVLMMPSSAFIYMFAPDIIRFIFERGAFDAEGVALTSAALRGIAIGLWASTLGWILLRLLNRAGRGTIAAAILVGSYVVNIIANSMTHTFFLGADNGTFYLGLGEACRGLFLGFAVVLSLSARWSVFKLVLKGLLPTGFMILLCLGILHFFEGTFIRLAVGACANIISILLGVAWIAPEAGKKMGRYIASRVGGRT